MRYIALFTAVASFGFAIGASAQDPFDGVPTEPRPDEYVHWDANAFGRFQDELEGDLRDGGGIWGTPFAYLNALPRADHRPHDVQIIHRSEYTQPEIHETKWDIYVVVDGTGTARVGGTRVDYDVGRPHEGQRPRLEGAREFPLVKGDILHVPARVWHQVVTEPGESITYALINVFE
jgi:mannose-6-phosphate isomerase-like protein (cupin superfamily)